RRPGRGGGAAVASTRRDSRTDVRPVPGIAGAPGAAVRLPAAGPTGRGATGAWAEPRTESAGGAGPGRGGRAGGPGEGPPPAHPPAPRPTPPAADPMPVQTPPPNPAALREWVADRINTLQHERHTRWQSLVGLFSGKIA